jgi:hypothetical protein
MYRTVALESEHWCSSVFANGDFDLQLKKHGIHRPIVVVLVAHACIEKERDARGIHRQLRTEHMRALAAASDQTRLVHFHCTNV